MNKMSVLLIALPLAVAAPGWGSVAEVDAILYGMVTIDEQVVDSNARVVARVDGVPEPVGEYIYGSCIQPPNGATCPPADRYYLKIRMESLVDNPLQTPGVDSARLGETVKIYVQQGDGEEVLAAMVPLNERGIARELDLVPGQVAQDPLFSIIVNWYGMPPGELYPQDLLQLLESLR